MRHVEKIAWQPDSDLVGKGVMNPPPSNFPLMWHKQSYWASPSCAGGAARDCKRVRNKLSLE